MTKKPLIILTLLIGTMLACNLPGVGSTPDESTMSEEEVGEGDGGIEATSEQSDSSEATEVPEIPDPTEAVPAEDATATPVLDNSELHFTNLRFAYYPDEERLVSTFFYPGTPEVYGIWDYQGMEPGMTIRRVWTLNGDEIWADRTLEWDFATYGESGTVKDVSIFEYDTGVGLPVGYFEVQLYVDGVLQRVTEDLNTIARFSISNHAEVAEVSPDGQLTAQADMKTPRTLEIIGPDGTLTVWNDREVQSVAWFGDSVHMVVVEIVGDPNPGVPYFFNARNLWLVNAANGDYFQLNEEGETFQEPVPSPDGRYIALRVGSLYGDACGIDSTFAVMRLSATFARIGLMTEDDLTGLPESELGLAVISYFEEPAYTWLGPETLQTSFMWICDEHGYEGYYAVDMRSGETEKIGEFED